jgi:hypothetical protein
MSSVFGSNYRCEQLFSLIKNVKSKTRTRLTDQHLQGCMRIATTEIKPDTEKLIKQKHQEFKYWFNKSDNVDKYDT